MKGSTSTHKQHETLRGELFTLRRFTVEDISDRYIGWLNDPQVNRFLEVRFVTQTREIATAYVSSYYTGVEKYMWGIYPNGVSELIGTATLHNIDRNHESGDVGLMIGSKVYWGKGASDDAIELIANLAFETLGLRRLSAGTSSPNLGINFTLKRLGFTHEGTLRKAYSDDSGNYMDGYRWGVLAEEWRARRQPGPGGGD